MLNIIDYYKELSSHRKEAKQISKSFLTFYIYFKKLNEKKILSNEAMNYLDLALNFSEPIFNPTKETERYLNNKEKEITEFLSLIKNQYKKIAPNIKRTFDIPNNYSYEEVCSLILHSYIAYASLRCEESIINSKTLIEMFPQDYMTFKLPEYIPDTNANIKDFLEMVSGIKVLSSDGKSYELFNVFNKKTCIRTIIDITDGQIATLFIDDKEYNEVPETLIKRLKRQIKKDSLQTKE